VVPELGEILGGKYRILRVLGEGGMGAVYEAENVLTLKRAAIKRLHAQMLAHDEGYQRVLHEARASARIRHHNVVDVYDVVSEGHAICLVMELLIGEPLSALIARGGLFVHEYVQLLLPAMQGVAAAHAVGVIHRDIKPENIFLVNEGGPADPVPKVIDFGISKVTDPGDAPQLTRSGITMGTPRYVSYEQLVGAKNVDERADVYAFGVMLYEALTGRAPYNANTFGQQAICFATTVPNRPRASRADVPPELDALVWRAIARDRDERFATLKDFIAQLTPYARVEPYGAPLPAFPEVAPDPNAAAFALTTNPVQTTPIPAGGWHETPRPAALVPVPVVTPPSEPKRGRAWLWGVALLALVAVALAVHARRAPPPLPAQESEAADRAAARDTAPSTPAQAGPIPAAPAAEVKPYVDESLRPRPVPGTHDAPAVPLRPARAALGGKPPASPGTPGESADAKAKSALSPAEQQKAHAAPEDSASQDSVHRAGRVRRDQF
jgi:tRNA A-37 threonylcarbamoyl transferase component Bud32